MEEKSGLNARILSRISNFISMRARVSDFINNREFFARLDPVDTDKPVIPPYGSAGYLSSRRRRITLTIR